MKQICVTELAKHVLDVIKINEIPYIKGSPGIGKSAMYTDIAKTLNLEFIDFRLSYCDQTVLNGFPVFKDGRSSWAPPKIFPLVGDPLPEGKDGWLISFEEINSAPQSIQAIAYKILHDRMLGDFDLHPKVRLCANGNLETDGAVVIPLSSALASRMVQFHAVIDPEKWLPWAETSGHFHQLQLDYFNYRKEHVHKFDPKSKDPAYACPRSHAKVGKLLKLCDEQYSSQYDVIRHSVEGSIGDVVTTDFYSFIKYFDSVIPLETIIKTPMTKPNKDIGIRYATLVNCINNLANNEHDIVQVVKHFEQNGDNEYSVEYPVMILKKMFRKYRKLTISQDAKLSELTLKYKKYLD